MKLLNIIMITILCLVSCQNDENVIISEPLILEDDISCEVASDEASNFPNIEDSNLEVNTAIAIGNNGVILEYQTNFTFREDIDSNTFGLELTKDIGGFPETNISLSLVQPIYDEQLVLVNDGSSSMTNSTIDQPWGGDVQNHLYNINPNESSTLQLLSYNRQDKTLTGQFSLFYSLTISGSEGPIPPENLCLPIGYFRVEVSEPSLFQ